MTFLYPSMIFLTLSIPFYLIIYSIGQSKQQRNLIFMTGSKKQSAGLITPVLVSLALLLLSFSSMRPVSNPRLKSVEQEGRNIVFVLDVSRSMLAEDLIPNRLERARFDILNSIGSLQGNRVALVAFAGVPVLKCPLTLDYVYFSQTLSELSTNSVSRGGTHMGDAIRIVIDDLFDNSDRDSMDIFLITDGEDQESFPVESAARAGKEGIRIVAVGLGNQDQGAPVPGSEEKGDEILMYENKPVYSRADMKTLQEMTESSAGGWAIPVSTGRIPMTSILREMKSTARQSSTGSVDRYEYDEQYRWFLIPGVIILIFSFLLEYRLLRRTGKDE